LQLIRSYKNFPKKLSGSVLTIGNFDGVHKGHKRVIKRVLELAEEKNLNALLMVFEPTPKEFFMGKAAPARLMRWRERYFAIQSTGIHALVQLKFNQKFSELSADEFVEEVLVKALGIKHLIVGDDFKYGHKRSGDFEHLLECGKKFGYSVEDTLTLTHLDNRVSSTAVRNALQDGQIELASELLGAPYSMSGKVIHGEKLGRTLGFPTLNIPVRRLSSPLHGVYAVQVHGLEEAPIKSIASIGTRPAVNGKSWLLEVHLIDRVGNYYGKRIDVEFLHFIRSEQNFPDLESLTTQMQLDLAQVKEYFLENRAE